MQSIKRIPNENKKTHRELEATEMAIIHITQTHMFTMY